MRVIGEIPHRDCKITLFHWNNRYLVKLERGLFEQTFKVQEYDLISEDDLSKIVSETFVNEAIVRFQSMEASLHSAMEQL